jgi:hypothetical protein
MAVACMRPTLRADNTWGMQAPTHRPEDDSMYDAQSATLSLWWPGEQVEREREARNRGLARRARGPRTRSERGGFRFPFIIPRPAAAGR